MARIDKLTDEQIAAMPAWVAALMLQQVESQVWSQVKDAMSTAAKKSPTDYYNWQPHLYKGCWIVYRWQRDGRDRTLEYSGGSNRGKPMKLFASVEEAISKAEELNA